MQSVWVLPEEETRQKKKRKDILQGVFIKLFLSLKLDNCIKTMQTTHYKTIFWNDCTRVAAIFVGSISFYTLI